MIRTPEICAAAIIVEKRMREKRKAQRKQRRFDTQLMLLHHNYSGMTLDQIVESFQPTTPGVDAMNLYNCKHADGEYRLTKFTKDYEVESSYVVSAEGCDCPAGIRPVCRHRTMLPFFLEHGHVDDGWFFIWDTRQWLRPIEDVVRPRGAPSTDRQQTEPNLDKALAFLLPEIEQPVEPSPPAQPAPPTVKTPIAPQTPPASAEGAGFRFRRPNL